MDNIIHHKFTLRNWYILLLFLLFLGGRTNTVLGIDLLGSLAAPPVNNGLIYDPVFGCN